MSGREVIRRGRPTSSGPKSKPGLKGPEAVQTHKLLGKPIRVGFWSIQGDLVGTLRWVDRYTICVVDEDDRARILFKHAIREFTGDSVDLSL